MLFVLYGLYLSVCVTRAYVLTAYDILADVATTAQRSVFFKEDSSQALFLYPLTQLFFSESKGKQIKDTKSAIPQYRTKTKLILTII